jgi:hypothetical protein
MKQLKYNGQHVSTRYSIIIRPIGAYVSVHENNMYGLGSHSVSIRVYWPDDDAHTGSKHVAHCTSVDKHIFQVLCTTEYSHLDQCKNKTHTDEFMQI